MHTANFPALSSLYTCQAHGVSCFVAPHVVLKIFCFDNISSPRLTLFTFFYAKVQVNINFHGNISLRHTVIMKRTHLMSLLLIAAEAAVLQNRHMPNYPGIQFGSDRKLSITVFSDLHFGERELL